MRLILALAAQDDLEVVHIDVDTAFLYGLIDRDVYMQMPRGFEKIGKTGKQMVCKLRKGIYGLKQAGFLWYRRLVEHLLLIGFKQLDSDNCIFVKTAAEGKIIITIHVDDILVAGKPMELIESFIVDMEQAFKMKRLGNVRWYSNMRVTRKRDATEHSIKMDQEQFISDTITAMNLSQMRSRTQPMDAGTDVHEMALADTQLDAAGISAFRGSVGKLMWATQTHPEVQHCTNLLSRVMHKATGGHVSSLNRVISFLGTVKSRGIKFVKMPGQCNRPRMWIDASHGGDTPSM